MCDLRRRVIDRAREYLDTPFLHQGRLKGKQVDCAGLVICIAIEFGFTNLAGQPISLEDFANYPAQPIGRMLQDVVEKHLPCKWKSRPGKNDLVPDISLLELGDVITVRAPKEPAHVALIGDLDGALSVIHAKSDLYDRRWRTGKVVEQRIDRRFLNRIEGVFVFPEYLQTGGIVEPESAIPYLVGERSGLH